MIYRVAAPWLAVLALSGCSPVLERLLERRSGSDSGYSSAPAGGDCRVSRGGCGYEGSYDKGEKDYAEDEAARLNQAEAERLRRATGR
jgi:hypothetical protein